MSTTKKSLLSWRISHELLLIFLGPSHRAHALSNKDHTLWILDIMREGTGSSYNTFCKHPWRHMTLCSHKRKTFKCWPLMHRRMTQPTGGFTVAMIIQRDSTDLIAWIKKLGIHPTGHGKQIKGASDKCTKEHKSHLYCYGCQSLTRAT